MDTTVRDSLRAAGTPSFLNDLRTLAAAAGPTPWQHADTPLLAGLERWGRALGERDLRAAVMALCAAAQYGLPQAIRAGGDMIANMGYRADEKVADGAPVETQLAVAAAQARNTAIDSGAVTAAFDPSRQAHAWSEEMQPSDDTAFFWYFEIGQCALAALRADGAAGDDDNESYYYWTKPAAAARGLVVAARGLRLPGTDLDAIVAALGKAMAA